MLRGRILLKGSVWPITEASSAQRKENFQWNKYKLMALSSKKTMSMALK